MSSSPAAHASSPSRPAGARALRAGAQVAACALAAVLTWFAWLGWESGYITDPATGAVSGPYAVWQVVACGLTLLALALVAGWWAPPWLAAPAITLGFTLAWTVEAAATDDSGLFAVGTMLLLVGLGTLTVLVCTAVWLMRRHRARR